MIRHVASIALFLLAISLLYAGNLRKRIAATQTQALQWEETARTATQTLEKIRELNTLLKESLAEREEKLVELHNAQKAQRTKLKKALTHDRKTSEWATTPLPDSILGLLQ